MNLLPRRFVEGRGEGAGFLIVPVAINTLIALKAVPQVLFFGGLLAIDLKTPQKIFIFVVFIDL